MMHEPGQAFANLAKIQDELKAYGKGGFFDAVAVDSGIDRPALPVPRPGHGHGRHRKRHGEQRDSPRASARRDVERALRPVIGVEEFGAGIA